jgi:hypothetical protein
MRTTRSPCEKYCSMKENFDECLQVDAQSSCATHPPPMYRDGKNGILSKVKFTRKICRKLIDIVSPGGYSRPGVADHGKPTISDNSEPGRGHAHSAKLRLHY